jgi:hypothetical protein
MHQQPLPPTNAVVQHMSRKLGPVEPSLLETDCTCVSKAAFGLRDGLFGGVVNAEMLLPFCACAALDGRVVGAGGLADWEDFGGAESVFCWSVIACTFSEVSFVFVFWVEIPTLRGEVN